MGIWSYEFPSAPLPLHAMHVNILRFSVHFEIFPNSLVISSLTFELFGSSFSILKHFEFSQIFLLLISSLIPLLSEIILYMISIFLRLLRLILCPSMWCTMEDVPVCLERMFVPKSWVVWLDRVSQ